MKNQGGRSKRPFGFDESRPRCGSVENLSVCFFVEPDDERSALAYGRRPKLSVTADRFEEFLFPGLFFLQVKKDDLLSDAGIDPVDLFHQIQDFLFGNRHLAGVDLFPDLDNIVRKKLLRSSAGLSGGPVIDPVHLCHAVLLFAAVRESYQLS